MTAMQALAFVDLETTGANATLDHITEIGIVEVDPDGSVREWQQLLNPGVRIPPFIEQLTGIRNEMVADAPPFAEVADEVRRRLAGRLFIAHNARFDYGFLKNAFRRLDIPFRAPTLCTVKLSRSLYPEHRKHNLDALSERHGLFAGDRHRALADARLIHQFWQKIVVDRGQAAIDAAVRQQLQHPALPPHLDASLLEDLPDTPGVYLFYGAAGDSGEPLLYVGKARRLRQRVLAHFAADHRSAKEMSLAQQVRRIDWEETGGEIGALLREAHLIKTQHPTHNRQLRRQQELCTWQLVRDEAGTLSPRLAWTRDLAPGNREACYGLFGSQREAIDTLRGLAERYRLCPARLALEQVARGRPCFSRQLNRCRGVCVGEESPLQHDIRLLEALTGLKLLAWPFSGPAVLVEGGMRHVIDDWRYLGRAENDAEVAELLANGRPLFDRDTYKILSRHLERLQPL